MDFNKAIEALQNGEKLKLPEWTGYWFKLLVGGDPLSGIQVMTASGDILDTPYLEDYRNRTDWEITDGSRDFGGAIKAAKAGKKICRIGWNGSGMYAVIMPGYPNGIPCNEATAKTHNVEEGSILKFRPYWQLFTAQGDISMWAPSGSDSLAEDWFIVNE